MDASRSPGLPVVAALACCLLVISGVLVVPAAATHEIFPELQCVSVPNVKKVHRTGYHFQPPKHWINGMLGIPQLLGVLYRVDCVCLVLLSL